MPPLYNESSSYHDSAWRSHRLVVVIAIVVIVSLIGAGTVLRLQVEPDTSGGNTDSTAVTTTQPDAVHLPLSTETVQKLFEEAMSGRGGHTVLTQAQIESLIDRAKSERAHASLTQQQIKKYTAYANR